MTNLTEGKHLGGRKAWGKGTQSIALAHHAIRGQNPPNFTPPKEDAAFKTMKAAYNTRLQGVLAKFRSGEITRGQFENQAKTAIRETFGKAYQLGAHRMGGGADHALDPQDETWVKGARYQEFGYLNKFADAIQNETYHVDPEQRMEMYANTLESMFWAGQISATADNAVIHWNLSPAEHCQDCLTLAANGPYTRKTLPAVPRAGSTQCLVGCKCYLSVAYDEQPAIDSMKLKPWKPMKEWGAGDPPPGTRPPTEEEKGFIDNLGLRIRFESDLARSAGQQPGNEHGSIAAGIAAALAAFLAARMIWAPPTWAVDDKVLVTGDEFETAFEQDRITVGELEAMSDEEFAAFLEAYEARFPSDVPRKVKQVVDRAVQMAGHQHEDKAREAMRVLLEFNARHDAEGRFARKDSAVPVPTFAGVERGFGKFPDYKLFNLNHDIRDAEGKVVHNVGSTVSERTLRKYGIAVPEAREDGTPLVEMNPFHDRLGRFAHAPATDGGGAYGTTAPVRSGSGHFGGREYVHGHEDDVQIPEAKQLSVLYNPKTGHTGWIEGTGSHGDGLEAMDIRRTEEREQYVHVNILGYPTGPFRRSLGVTVTSAADTVGNRVEEAGAVNKTFAMLRKKGFPDKTPVTWRQWNGISRDVKLGETVTVNVEDPTLHMVRRLMPRKLLTSESREVVLAGVIASEIRQGMAAQNGNEKK